MSPCRQEPVRVVEWVAETMPDVKKVGLIAPNDAVGQQAITTLVDRYGSQGFEAWTDFYERGSKEFTPLLLRMISEDVDLFDLNSNAPGEAALLLRQARTGKEKYGVDHQIVIPFYIMKVADGVGEVEAKIVPDLN